MSCVWLKRSERYRGSGNPFHGRKHTPDTIARLKAMEHRHVKTERFRRGAKERMLGPQNKMRGTSIYQLQIKKYGKEKADLLLEEFRRRTSKMTSGSGNPMYGKPSPQGSGNGWSGWYRGWFFRSLRELSFMVKVIEAQRLNWETAEAAELTIPYVDHQGRKRSYRADFLVEGTRLVEVKPTRLHRSPTVDLKRLAAEAFCKSAGFTYELVDPELLSSDEIRAMRGSSLIRFTDRYEAKFEEKFNAKT